MTVDLLAVVQAEAQAEAIIAEANSRREELLKAAEKERQQKLANLETLSVEIPSLPSVKADATKLKDAAQRNKAAAVKRILEEVYAS